MSSCIAIVVAAGRGQRFGATGPKQYADLGGQTVLRRALQAFLGHPGVSGVLPVIHGDDRAALAEATAGLTLLPPVTGGATRQASVRNGLEALGAAPPESVLIHDAARPFVPADVIGRVIAAIKAGVGAVPSLPVADTLKRIDAGGAVGETVDRDGLVRVQTPQGFRFTEILAAHRNLAGESLTDDAAVFTRAGYRVVSVAGAQAADKITTTDDLERLSQLVLESRIGQGYDAHRFTAGDGVILCGVKIPHSHKLLGHSDADAALHAATDAVLGACGQGDIGQHFPPSNPSYKDAPSERFLRHALDLLRRMGGDLVNLDITIVCERPKIAPHRAAMVARVAEICGLSPSRISVKATTTEGMGFTGRAEGIAAQAVATVKLPKI